MKLGSLGAIASNSISSLSNAQFSQQQEKQADEIGLTLLTQEYNHAAGATDFFARLEAQKKQLPNLAILASHPPSEARVQQLEDLIDERGYQLKDKAPLPDAIENATNKPAVSDQP